MKKLRLRKWQTIKSRRVFQNRAFEIFEDQVFFPDNTLGKFSFLRRKDGVSVIAFDGKKVYLVNQFRYSFKKRFWEFVAGKTESGTPLEQAKQELKEEAGLLAKKWTYLGQFACGPGHTNQRGRVFLAEDLRQGEPEREPPEADMYVKKFSIAEVDKMIESGKIIDSWSIVPWYFFKDYLKSQSPHPNPLRSRRGRKGEVRT